MFMRSPFAPVLLALVALIGALARWATQGSGNLYTAVAKRFYVPDPDLGWKVSPEHPIWLGLEVCAIIAAIAVGLAVGGLVIRTLETRSGKRQRLLRLAAWVVAAAPLAVPLVSFLSGGAPADARDTLPAARAVALEEGVQGSLDLEAGEYSVVAHRGNAITAKLTAGGEAFDARFAGDLAGSIEIAPRALATRTIGEISVATASVDTGIGERSKHAREGYLLAGTHPRLTFTLGELVAARQDTPNIVAFRARGTITLIGKAQPVEVIGTLSRPDAAGLARLGLTGDVLIVNAQLSLRIKDTALAPDAADFDGDHIPVNVTLMLRRNPLPGKTT